MQINIYNNGFTFTPAGGRPTTIPAGSGNWQYANDSLFYKDEVLQLQIKYTDVTGITDYATSTTIANPSSAQDLFNKLRPFFFRKINEIADSSITLAKQANVGTGTVFYRKTAGTGVPEVQTLATLKTDAAYKSASLDKRIAMRNAVTTNSGTTAPANSTVTQSISSDGKTIQAIANECGVTHVTIYNWLVRHELIRNPVKKPR
jgi:hypothetical protein